MLVPVAFVGLFLWCAYRFHLPRRFDSLTGPRRLAAGIMCLGGAFFTYYGLLQYAGNLSGNAGHILAVLSVLVEILCFFGAIKAFFPS